MICHTNLQFKKKYSEYSYVSVRGFMLLVILWQTACVTGNNIPDSLTNSVALTSLNNAYLSADGNPAAEVNNRFNLASEAYTSGDVDQAELHLRKVIELQPTNAKATYNLSMIYLRRAYDGLSHYLSIAPDSPARYRAESLLEGLDELDSSGE